MFNGGVDVSHMITTMDKQKAMTSEADPETRTRGQQEGFLSRG